MRNHSLHSMQSKRDPKETAAPEASPADTGHSSERALQKKSGGRQMQGREGGSRDAG